MNLFSSSRSMRFKRSSLTRASAFVVLAIGFTAFGLSFLGALGCAFTILAMSICLLSSDRPLPLQWLITSVAGLQLILIPSLVYLRFGEYASSPMLVPEDEYSALAVPGVIFMAMGLFLFSASDRRFQLTAAARVARTEELKRLFVPAMVLSIVGTIGRFFAPGEIGFALYLLASLKFAGTLLLIYQRNRWSVPAVIVVLGISLIEAASSGIFHDFLLWGTIIFMAVCHQNNIRPLKRIIFLLVCVLFVASLQTVKGTYRSELSRQGAAGEITVYGQLTADRATEIIRGEYDLDAVYASTLERLNQGAIVSSVMRYTSVRGYAGGETIYEGLLAALVPRFLKPDKATAGGQKTFERFTGRQLNETTSMGVSLLGEGFGNFGLWGAIFFMGLYGAGMATLLRLMESYFRESIIGFLLLPSIYLHAIKAETDFVTTVNHVVKATVFFALIVWLAGGYIRRIGLKKKTRRGQYTTQSAEGRS